MDLLQAFVELPELVADFKRVSQELAQLLTERDRDKLLTEADAMAYLGRDADTLRYYRTLGLESYKKGRDRWYRKSDIDAWLASGKVSRQNR